MTLDLTALMSKAAPARDTGPSLAQQTEQTKKAGREADALRWLWSGNPGNKADAKSAGLIGFVDLMYPGTQYSPLITEGHKFVARTGARIGFVADRADYARTMLDAWFDARNLSQLSTVQRGLHVIRELEKLDANGALAELLRPIVDGARKLDQLFWDRLSIFPSPQKAGRPHPAGGYYPPTPGRVGLLVFVHNHTGPGLEASQLACGWRQIPFTESDYIDGNGTPLKVDNEWLQRYGLLEDELREAVEAAHEQRHDDDDGSPTESGVNFDALQAAVQTSDDQGAREALRVASNAETLGQLTAADVMQLREDYADRAAETPAEEAARLIEIGDIDAANRVLNDAESRSTMSPADIADYRTMANA